MLPLLSHAPLSVTEAGDIFVYGEPSLMARDKVEQPMARGTIVKVGAVCNQQYDLSAVAASCIHTTHALFLG